MTKQRKKSAPRPRSAPGPKTDVPKINGKWQDAVKQSLQKKKTSGRLAEIT